MSKKEKQVRVSFTNDRLWEQKLSQVYHLLVPSNEPVIFIEQCPTQLTEKKVVYENSSDIYQGVLGSAEGK
jgi:hypothetical protein